MRIGLRYRRAGMLDRVLIPKRAEVARMLAGLPSLPPRHAPKAGLLDALPRGPGQPLRLFTEIKLRSPSAGDLSRALSVPDRALAYAAGGATMISVLTDGPFFGGSFDDLRACREALDAALGPRRPFLLCKEYVLHEVQLDRALDAGADAVLLIVRILERGELPGLLRAAEGRGLTPLVEVATLEELARARDAGARLIGVNARDLNTLKMDPERAAEVLAAVKAGQEPRASELGETPKPPPRASELGETPKPPPRASELGETPKPPPRASELGETPKPPPRAIAAHLSGLATPDDVARVAKGPADAALIGEALMRRDDPRELLAAMVAAAKSATG